MATENEKNINLPEAFLSKEYWDTLLKSVDVYEIDEKNVILNYLTTCGYDEVAEEFCKEAQLKPSIPPEVISTRNKIRKYINDGDWLNAFKSINSISGEIFEKYNIIGFKLKQQQLLQIIKEGEAFKAIEYARKEVAPFILQTPNLLNSLEDTMSLLAFNNFQDPEVQKIIKRISLPENFFKLIDEALFEFYSLYKEPVLNFLLKNILHAQSSLQLEMNCLSPCIEELHTGKMILKNLESSKLCDDMIFNSTYNLKPLTPRTTCNRKVSSDYRRSRSAGSLMRSSSELSEDD